MGNFLSVLLSPCCSILPSTEERIRQMPRIEIGSVPRYFHTGPTDREWPFDRPLSSPTSHSPNRTPATMTTPILPTIWPFPLNDSCRAFFYRRNQFANRSLVVGSFIFGQQILVIRTNQGFIQNANSTAAENLQHCSRSYFLSLSLASSHCSSISLFNASA